MGEKWIIQIDTPYHLDEDLINKLAGQLAGRIGSSTAVDIVQRLEQNEKVKVVLEEEK